MPSNRPRITNLHDTHIISYLTKYLSFEIVSLTTENAASQTEISSKLIHPYIKYPTFIDLNILFRQSCNRQEFSAEHIFDLISL